MNLIDLICLDGIELKRVGSTNGGEHAGPCPFCGGNDRFRVWPEHKGGRYWCRGCHKTGDAIQYLRDSQGLSYRDACRKLNIAISTAARPLKRKTTKPKFTPKKSAIPDQVWSEKAQVFLNMAKEIIHTDHGVVASTSFLYSRGLSESTISQANLGWNLTDLYRDRQAWGLVKEMRFDGRPKPLWLPAGLVIPYLQSGNIVRLRIRRNDSNIGPRYVIIPGSTLTPMLIWQSQSVLVVVESELDALLINQEASDLAGVCALGSVAARPDHDTHEILNGADQILVSLDSDEPGSRESWHFWKTTYGQKAKRWPVPVGKDPTDAYQKGLDIRLWIEAGLDDDFN